MLSILEEGGLVWVPHIKIKEREVGENLFERDLFSKLFLSDVKPILLDKFN